MIYSVSPELNERIAEELLEAIGTRNFFSGSVRVVSDDDVECTLRTSCVVYRRPVVLPEGEGRAIRSVIPVWWELHTVCAAGVLDNDFSFGDLHLENME